MNCDQGISWNEGLTNRLASSACAFSYSKAPMLYFMHRRLSRSGGKCSPDVQTAGISIEGREADTFHCDACYIGGNTRHVVHMTL